MYTHKCLKRVLVHPSEARLKKKEFSQSQHKYQRQRKAAREKTDVQRSRFSFFSFPSFLTTYLSFSLISLISSPSILIFAVDSDHVSL